MSDCPRWAAERATLPAHTDTDELAARATWHAQSCPTCRGWHAPEHLGRDLPPDGTTLTVAVLSAVAVIEAQTTPPAPPPAPRPALQPRATTRDAHTPAPARARPPAPALTRDGGHLPRRTPRTFSTAPDLMEGP